VQIRQRIGQVDRAFDGVGVETIVERRRRPSRQNRGAREAIVPGDRHTFRIEARRDAVEEAGPIHVVLDVFLARPHDLDRAVDLFGDLDRANGTIDLQPPAEGSIVACARKGTW